MHAMRQLKDFQIGRAFWIVIAILCLIEVSHIILSYLLFPFRGNLDVAFHSSSQGLVFIVSLMLLVRIAKQFLISEIAGQWTFNVGYFSCLVAGYYWIFILLHAALLWVSEGTVRGAGLFMRTPVLGSFFDVNSIMAIYLAMILLPIGLLAGLLGLVIQRRGRLYFLECTSFRTALFGCLGCLTVLLALSRVSSFILD